MNKTLIISVIAIVAMVSIVAAQDILVEYTEGTVELRGSRGWSEVFIGDSVPGNATIRVGDDGMVELRGAERTVLLARAGTYDLATILSAVQPAANNGVGSLMQGRIRQMVRDEVPQDTTVAGVRASEAVERDAVTWAGGESTYELIEEGLAALDDGDYEDAYLVFYDAWEFAGTDELPEIEFYLGYSAYLIGNIGEALDFLESSDPDPDADYYDDHVLTLAQVLVEGYAFDDAIDLLESYIERDPADEDLQVAYLLEGLAYNGSGDTRRARQKLDEARRIDPTSETGALAGEISDSL